MMGRSDCKTHAGTTKSFPSHVDERDGADVFLSPWTDTNLWCETTDEGLARPVHCALRGVPVYSPGFASAHCTWRRSTVVERWYLTGELSLSCARLLAGRMITLWVRRPLSVNQHGQLSIHPLGVGK